MSKKNSFTTKKAAVAAAVRAGHAVDAVDAVQVAGGRWMWTLLPAPTDAEAESETRAEAEQQAGDGTEGQDRESYTDDQDREGYTLDAPEGDEGDAVQPVNAGPAAAAAAAVPVFMDAMEGDGSKQGGAAEPLNDTDAAHAGGLPSTGGEPADDATGSETAPPADDAASPATSAYDVYVAANGTDAPPEAPEADAPASEAADGTPGGGEERAEEQGADQLGAPGLDGYCRQGGKVAFASDIRVGGELADFARFALRMAAWTPGGHLSRTSLVDSNVYAKLRVQLAAEGLVSAVLAGREAMGTPDAADADKRWSLTDAGTVAAQALGPLSAGELAIVTTSVSTAVKASSKGAAKAAKTPAAPKAPAGNPDSTAGRNVEITAAYARRKDGVARDELCKALGVPTVNLIHMVKSAARRYGLEYEIRTAPTGRKVYHLTGEGNGKAPAPSEVPAVRAAAAP